MAVNQYGGVIEQVATIVTAAGTTTLINTSKQVQVFTGSTIQTVVLPNSTTFTTSGAKFEFYNESTGAITVKYQDSTNLATVTPGNALVIKCSDNTTANGTWVKLSTSAAGGLYVVGSTQTVSGGGTLTLNNAASQYIPVAGSGGPIILAVVPFSPAPNDGTYITLEGTDNTNTVTVINNNGAGGAVLNGNATLGQYDTLTLVYRQALNLYIEIARS